MSHVRILVVDDEPQIRRFLKTTLEVHGYDVALAENGRAALEQITTWRPDVILLDLGLPEIDLGADDYAQHGWNLDISEVVRLLVPLSSPPGTRWVPGVAVERGGWSPARPGGRGAAYG